MPIPEPFLSAIEEGDRFLVSFPRSGNRWMWVLIADLVNQAKGLDPSEMYETQIGFEKGIDSAPRSCLPKNRIIPDSYMDPREVYPEILEVLQPTFRTHNFNQVFARAHHPIVYLFRKPANVFVSHYHYVQSDNDPAVRNLDVNGFAQSWVPLWRDHITSALEGYRKQPERILLIEYQDRLPFNLQQLALVSSFLGLNCHPRMIRMALRRFRRFHRTLNRKHKFPYPRSHNGDVSAFYNDEVSETIKYFTAELYEEISHMARRQSEEFESS